MASKYMKRCLTSLTYLTCIREMHIKTIMSTIIFPFKWLQLSWLTLSSVCGAMEPLGLWYVVEELAIAVISWGSGSLLNSLGCGQNSVLCGCKTEDAAFLLAVNTGLFSAPRDCSVFSAMKPALQHGSSLSKKPIAEFLSYFKYL